jgi:hypothetical protein
MGYPKPETAGKGKKGENCNVTHCQKPESAFYYNRVMNAWYCEDCALKIEASANAQGNSFYDNLEENIRKNRRVDFELSKEKNNE